ncbi:uncharacterized protein LOC143150594 [Ptiloglossa arizonensis]|uniref:uncharacterized protein LOC143150594 n=1 Tax=Ptiloglossa arizonensis TaxID=3350558 RepID=UPI003F9F8B55
MAAVANVLSHRRRNVDSFGITTRLPATMTVNRSTIYLFARIRRYSAPWFIGYVSSSIFKQSRENFRTHRTGQMYSDRHALRYSELLFGRHRMDKITRGER